MTPPVLLWLSELPNIYRRDPPLCLPSLGPGSLRLCLVPLSPGSHPRTSMATRQPQQSGAVRPCPGKPDPLGSRRRPVRGDRRTGFPRTHARRSRLTGGQALAGPRRLTPLEPVRLIKLKSWEDVWVSHGLWKAFWPPPQTTGRGAWASGFDTLQANEHLANQHPQAGPAPAQEVLGKPSGPQGARNREEGRQLLRRPGLLPPLWPQSPGLGRCPCLPPTPPVLGAAGEG